MIELLIVFVQYYFSYLSYAPDPTHRLWSTKSKDREDLNVYIYFVPLIILPILITETG